MNKRELELIYEDYLDEIENPIELENIKYQINDKEKIIQLFSQPVKIKKKEIPDIKPKNVYLFFKEHIPIYYVIYDKTGNFYEVLKISNYYELANQNDLFTKINEETFIIETWNKFYLTEEEIKESVYFGKLLDEDFEILKTFLEGKIDQLPQNKRGLTVPEGNYNFYQNKFHKKESEIVRDFTLRVFDIIEEDEKSLMATIELPPERLQEQLLAAGEEKTVYRGDNFILFIDEENKIIELEPSEELIGKPILLKIYDEEYRFENLPEKIKLLIPEKYTGKINIDYIGRNIHIEGK